MLYRVEVLAERRCSSPWAASPCGRPTAVLKLWQPLLACIFISTRMHSIWRCLLPSCSYEGDPMRLLFSKSASPHHGFAAYYTYLEKIFGVGGLLCLFALLRREPDLQAHSMAGTCSKDGLSCLAS